MKDNFVLMTLTWDKEPDLAEVAKHLGIPVKSLDKEFGLVNVDSETNTYAFRVREKEWEKLNKENTGGPFSDPRIEPFDLQ